MPHFLAADVFTFKHKTGDKYRYISTTKEEAYLNGKLMQTSNMVNRMASEVTGIDNGIAKHSAVFNVAEEIIEANNEKRLQWGEEEYNSVFARDNRGNITIDKKYFMPSARNVPCFPVNDIQPGHTWLNRANEVLDLRKVFNMASPYEIPFTANNTYVGERERNNKTYKVFTIDYTLFKREGFEDNPRTYLTDKKNKTEEAVKPGIKNIRGKSKQTIYWDAERGAIAAADDEFELRFELSSGDVYLFKGVTNTELLEAETLDKEDVAREIEADLKTLGIEDASVRVVDEGIAISMEDIQFAADSAELLPSEKLKLDKIAEILRKYNSRDILVGGHTAQAGKAEFRVPLSEQRAAAVAGYFVGEKVRPASRIITRGYGASRPVASNDTEEGRRKNRRVEITIMEN
ncbi:MAG: OmpA family protein [Spirochaetaceae bacterium]|nr:OmpA family protein [Spirochaetaceae bacterium]